MDTFWTSIENYHFITCESGILTLVPFLLKSGEDKSERDIQGRGRHSVLLFYFPCFCSFLLHFDGSKSLF